MRLLRYLRRILTAPSPFAGGTETPSERALVIWLRGNR